MAFWQALSTVLAREGIPGVRSYGRFVPYVYQDSVLPLREDECLLWLDERLNSEREHYRAILEDAQQYAELFASWKQADAHDVSRPRFNQLWFAGLDAAIAYTMVRKFEPDRIIEVGSGHSTRFMARAIADGGMDTDLHSIDPQPRRDIDTLCRTITRDSVTRMPVELFDALAANDILFIDGSHALLPGSDVDYLFTRVLPRLAEGVVVHVHDIFLPYGYPSSWHRRAYTEQSMLAALLLGGRRFEILAPNAWLRRNEASAVDNVWAHLPNGAFEAGFWMRVAPACATPPCTAAR
jgi:predicted O-methyltransferase YrrM